MRNGEMKGTFSGVGLTDRFIKSNLAVGVGAESPQVDILYSESHRAEGVYDSLLLRLKRGDSFFGKQA